MLDSWRRDGYSVIVIDDIDDPEDAAADVRLVFDDGDRYAATFYTPKRIQNELTKKRESEKLPKKRYWCCTDGIVVERVTLEVIASTVDDLVLTGEYARVMQLG
jgi:hypothetical protein